MTATGRCLCGAVSFRAEGVDGDLHSCHCAMCRRWSGGPGMAVGVAGVTFQGAEHITRYASSDWAERGFCKHCGSNLFYRLKARDEYHLWLGTFDDQEPFRLASEIFIDEKPDSYEFAGDRPRLTGKQMMAAFEQASD